MSELRRRGFLGLGLALVAAPAIVRAESLMKVIVPAPNWKDFVREVYAYDIRHDAFFLRYDLKAGAHHWHVDGRVRPQLSGMGPVPQAEMVREAALRLFQDNLRHHNVNPRTLQHLPLPQGVDWAKRGVA